MEKSEVLNILSEKWDYPFELVSGEIVPKESSEPLSEEFLQFLLSDTADDVNIFKFFNMASYNHTEIIARLSEMIYSQINLSVFKPYVNSVRISKKYLGILYIPDIAVFLTESRIKTADGSLENPHTVIEVLSPGTEKKDRNEKLKNYQQIDSVQECLLIAQDCYKIEQYLREGKTKWTVKVYDSQHDTLILTVGVKVQLSELYKETDWA